MPMKSAASAPSRQNVINLMEALKRSLAVERLGHSLQKAVPVRTAAARKTASSKSSPVRREGGGRLSFSAGEALSASTQPPPAGLAV